MAIHRVRKVGSLILSLIGGVLVAMIIVVALINLGIVRN